MIGDTPLQLPDGLYPFIDQRLPLAELTMVEAPPQLARGPYRSQAAWQVQIIRDQPVELHCESEEFSNATFLIYWR